MKQIGSKIPKAIGRGAKILTCDNSGAKLVRLISIKGSKTKKGKYPAAGIGDMIACSVIKGTPEMRKQVVAGVVVRQKKEFRRPDGTRVKFEDNAVIICKDNKGTPKGTAFKGPIAKEATFRWPGIGKIAKIIV
ncbi:MAG: 50S ribosomal protein L14 [Nanoarchaeota archaeon]|nr:50S ribosomal protein L14 [Nanoarchaeota archaeon]MBU1445019.1 50S ribosomal protein L14 [Nanoarchaeota archaeon]MBU2420029.1 50S ribosomal protein L14 [Nanoarchaeota archaeon]MBU2475491.1 50S ribosomal protein L14 [Nanoarchaeota archaeon]MBU3940544.1 50S ribosomal protein L14 [Nanoarchaeota archaeon]